MIRNTRTLFTGVVVLVLAALANYAYANPGVAACALIDAIPGEGMDREQASLVSEARRRVTHAFGAPRAKPAIVFWNDESLIGRLRLNDHASTQMIGVRSCVFIGPKGRSVDVVAHELVHAEVFERVGPWARITQVPTWFDEGLAMQVDFRKEYVLPEEMDTAYIRDASSPAIFFVADEEALTRNYGAAKTEAARWVAGVGGELVYAQLARIRAGEAFANVVASRSR